MPPPPVGRSGAGGSCSERDCSAAGHDRSPHLSPSGLGLGSRSSPVAGPSRSGDGGRSSPSTSGSGDDDRSSTVDSFDFDWDDSFRAVLRLIREFQFGGTGKCSPKPVQDFSCTGFRATIRVFPGSSLACFPFTEVSP